MSAPLAGKTVLWTRPVDGDDAVATALEDAGAVLVRVPVLAFAPLADEAGLVRALAGVHDALVLTSPRAVDVMAGRIRADLPVAVLGAGTRRRAVARRFSRILNVEDTRDGEELGRVLAQRGLVRGRRFLLPVSQLARPAVADVLRAHGATVDVVEAYRTVAITDLPPVDFSKLHAVVCMSPSAVDALCALVPGSTLAGLVRAAPGGTTAAAWKAHDLPAQAVAMTPTGGGLIHALAAALRGVEDG